MSSLLASRYRNDGVSIVALNAEQLLLRDAVQAKVESGNYGTESTACAGCGLPDFAVLAEKDRYGLAFRVVICTKCGLIYTNPRMDASAYARFYDQEYRALYHGHADIAQELFDHGWSRGADIADFFRKSGFPLNGKKIVDVGCGAGGTIAYLRDMLGCDVAGCDFGSHAASLGREKYGLKIEEGDISAIEMSGWKPDVVLYIHVFEHVLDLERECKLIRTALSPGGMVYIEVPSVKNIRNAFEWNFLRLLQNAHTYHFTLASLTNVMRRNGFDLVQGNEYAMTIFTPAQPDNNFVDDRAAVLSFLQTTERLYPIMNRWILIRRKSFVTLVALLKKIGVGSMLKRLRRRPE